MARRRNEYEDRNKTEEVELYFHGSTSMAIRVSEFDISEQFWLPRSQIEIIGNMRKDNDSNDIIKVEVPVWLLEEKGLL